jgi:hypothetical protein
MASSQLTNVVLSEVPRHRAGSASGVATTNNAIGAALGVAALGAVLRLGPLTNATSARWSLLTAAALLAVGSGCSFRIRVAPTNDTPHTVTTNPTPETNGGHATERRHEEVSVNAGA